MYKKLFIFFNFALLGVLCFAIWRSSHPMWMVYQRNYYNMAANEMEKQAAETKDPKEAAKIRKQAEEL
ncbi:MAG: hypothetical protein KGI84_08280, partial [Elusimicrobia bacterium]|nr:hypothetical protein [Elusimicrobiota bacterium]